jgi:hypothetical protein
MPVNSNAYVGRRMGEVPTSPVVNHFSQVHDAETVRAWWLDLPGATANNPTETIEANG